MRRVYGEDAVEERMQISSLILEIQRSGRSCLEQPQSGRPSAFSDLYHAITISPRPPVDELEATFQVHKGTVEKWLVF